MSSTDHKTPRYVVFSTSLLPRLSEAQISSSVPYSQIPTAWFLLQFKKPIFTSIENNEQNYISVYIKLLILDIKFGK